MTREQFVQKYRWDQFMVLPGIVNVIALIPQPLKILRTHDVEALSITMFVLFFFVQVSFSIEFYIKKSWWPMLSLSISAVLSLLTIGLILYFR